MDSTEGVVLTTREQLLLQRLYEGRSLWVISRAFGGSLEKLDQEIAQLCQKLQATTAAQAVAIAVDNGILANGWDNEILAQELWTRLTRFALLVLRSMAAGETKAESSMHSKTYQMGLNQVEGLFQLPPIVVMALGVAAGKLQTKKLDLPPGLEKPPTEMPPTPHICTSACRKEDNNSAPPQPKPKPKAMPKPAVVVVAGPPEPCPRPCCAPNVAQSTPAGISFQEWRGDLRPWMSSLDNDSDITYITPAATELAWAKHLSRIWQLSTTMPLPPGFRLHIDRLAHEPLPAHGRDLLRLVAAQHFLDGMVPIVDGHEKAVATTLRKIRRHFRVHSNEAAVVFALWGKLL